MFTNPSFEGIDWDLEDFHNWIYLVDDFSFNMLKSLIKYFKTGKSQQITFNVENHLYTFRFKGVVELNGVIVSFSAVKFSKKLIMNLKEDLEFWDDSPLNRENKKNYDDLVQLISALEIHLSVHEDRFLSFVHEKFIEISNPLIDEDIRKYYFMEFEELNKTTSSIYDLGDLEVLIILKDGTNLTSWDDVKDKNDVLFVSEDLSNQKFLSGKYSDLNYLESIVVKGIGMDVSSLAYMFSSCLSLRYVFGMDSWNLSNLENIDGMFMNCLSLEDISFLKSFDASNVVSAKAMFQNCISLYDTYPLECWDVGNMEDMHAMFCLCQNLDSLEGLKSWDVSNVKSMESMFHGCDKLSNLSYLADWKLNSIETLFEMFRECPKLENIDALDKWDIDEDVTTESMFKCCGNAQNPKWYLNSTNEIEEYVKGIESEDELIDIAYNHENYIACKFAVEHIRDENVLKDIIQNSCDMGVLEAAIKNKNLNDNEFLKNQLKERENAFAFGSLIISRLDDKRCLIDIVDYDYPPIYKILAINRISERFYLQGFVNNEDRLISRFALLRIYSDPFQ